MSITIAERLAALKKGTDTSIKTKEAALIPTPLSVFLSIYNQAGLDKRLGGSCYTNYMQGAKLLIDWLSPISIPDIDTKLLPKHMPNWFHAYEIQQLAMLLVPYLEGEEMRDHLNKQKYMQLLLCHLAIQEMYL